MTGVTNGTGGGGGGGGGTDAMALTNGLYNHKRSNRLLP